MNMNPNKSEMWSGDPDSKSYKLAVYSSKIKHPILKYLFHFIEVVVAMLANVLQAQYMLVIILTLVAA